MTEDGLGVLQALMQRIESDVHEIKADVKAQATIYATKEHVAELKSDLGREIGVLRTRVDALNGRVDDQQTKPPVWPSILVGFTGVVSVVIALVALLARS